MRCATEKLLTVGAGDNVVRLLPPLIVSEAEIDDAVARPRAGLRRAVERDQLKKAAG